MTTLVKNRTPIIIPTAIRKRAGLKAGDRLEFKVSGKVITVAPMADDSDDEYTFAERKAIDACFAQAEEDIREGRTYGPFSTAEEMVASIKAEMKKLPNKIADTPRTRRKR